VAELLKLTAFFNETLESGSGLVARRVLDEFQEAGVHTSILLRGIEGFGAHHRLHSELHEAGTLNQPVTAIAVDEEPRIRELLPTVQRVLTRGLVTLERATTPEAAPSAGHDPAAPARVTVFCGRADRYRGASAARAVIAGMRAAGAHGAVAYLGVDGTLAGRRQRATILSANRTVPVMVVGFGPLDDMLSEIADVCTAISEPNVLVERVSMLKVNGGYMADLPEVDADAELWEKLTVYAAGDASHEGRPLHYHLVEALRRSGAAGATSLRGTWGFRGSEQPHGDRALALGRRAPVATITVDRPSAIRERWPIVDDATAGHGMVIRELVPVLLNG
jgi:PII-like signaling protein